MKKDSIVSKIDAQDSSQYVLVDFTDFCRPENI
jgi:hypothetical protein